MLAIEKIAKIDAVMEMPEIKILTAENYEEMALGFYIRVKKFVKKYGVDALFENVLKFITNKGDEIQRETDEEQKKYFSYRQVYTYYNQFRHELAPYYNYSKNSEHKYFLKRLLDETKDADVEEAKEKLAKKYTPYFVPRVANLFDIEEFKKAIEKRKKLYIIADRMPAVREEAQELAKIALEEGYQAFIEIDGVTKEIKNNKKEEETEQTTVGCVILDLHSINYRSLSTIYEKKTEDSDLFIFLRNSDYKDESKHYTKYNAHEYCWMNTRKRVAVYYYKGGEEHPSEKITRGFSLYTNAGHYECALRDEEERQKKRKEHVLTYIITYLHYAKKEGSNLKNIIKKAKGEDVALREKEQQTYEDIKRNITSIFFNKEDEAEILDTALALVEEPEEKEELPDKPPCINESFDYITELTEHRVLMPELILNDIKARAKKDGYTKNQLRQLFEKAIRAEKEVDEISEDAQIQNAFYRLFRKIKKDDELGRSVASIFDIIYIIYTTLPIEY